MSVKDNLNENDRVIFDSLEDVEQQDVLDLMSNGVSFYDALEYLGLI